MLHAEKLYSESKYFPSETKGGLFVQSAMTVIDFQTGEVKALMGGAQVRTPARLLNRATSAYRQPGSCIKAPDCLLDGIGAGPSRFSTPSTIRLINKSGQFSVVPQKL
jgi:penicillin-binding protein 1A